MTSRLDVVVAGGGPAGVMAGLLFAVVGARLKCSKSTPTSSATFAGILFTLQPSRSFASFASSRNFWNDRMTR